MSPRHVATTLYDLLPLDENFSTDHLLGKFLDYVEGRRLMLYPAQAEEVAYLGIPLEKLAAQAAPERWAMLISRIFHELPCGTARRGAVAQVSNLPYRRLPVGSVPTQAERPAGWKPAIQQIENLRYASRSPSACEISGLSGAACRMVFRERQTLERRNKQ
jgi:hypothetical protein